MNKKYFPLLLLMGAVSATVYCDQLDGRRGVSDKPVTKAELDERNRENIRAVIQEELPSFIRQAVVEEMKTRGFFSEFLHGVGGSLDETVAGVQEAAEAAANAVESAVDSAHGVVSDPNWRAKTWAVIKGSTEWVWGYAEPLGKFGLVILGLDFLRKASQGGFAWVQIRVEDFRTPTSSR